VLLGESQEHERRFNPGLVCARSDDPLPDPIPHDRVENGPVRGEIKARFHIEPIVRREFKVLFHALGEL